MTDHVGHGDRRILAPWRAVRRYPNTSHATGVDDSRNARIARRIQDVPGPFHIVSIQLFRIARAEAVVRGYVEQPLAATERTIERCPVC